MADPEDELLELEDDGEAVDYEDYDLEEEEEDEGAAAPQGAGECAARAASEAQPPPWAPATADALGGFCRRGRAARRARPAAGSGSLAGRRARTWCASS
jgi:hypothetical protein